MVPADTAVARSERSLPPPRYSAKGGLRQGPCRASDLAAVPLRWAALRLRDQARRHRAGRHWGGDPHGGRGGGRSRSDRPDAGWRADARGRRGRDRGASPHLGAGGFTCGRVPAPARSRSSTSAASPIGSSRKGQSTRCRSRAGGCLDISDFPTRHPYTLGLWQNHIERILAGWVDELGVPIRHGLDVTGCVQDDGGVVVRLAGGEELAPSTSSAPTAVAAPSARRPGSTSPGGRRPRAP